eukprot:4706051-Lingulodinium_polyedra.AAC.1
MNTNTCSLEARAKARARVIPRTSDPVERGRAEHRNPMGRDGRIMQCYTPGCGSTTHLKRDCPMAGGKNS